MASFVTQLRPNLQMTQDADPYVVYYEDELDVDDSFCKTDSIREMEIALQTYIYSFICVFGFLGNVMVIITYTFYKKAKSMTDVYLLNVAIADLMFIMALPFIISNEHSQWSMGNAACKLLRTSYSLNLYSSMLLLACISADRYIAIVQARRSFGIHSRTLVYSRLICATIWLFAVVLSTPTIIYNQSYTEEDPHGKTTVECGFNFGHNSTEVAGLVKILVPSLQMSVGFCLPLVVMVFCYSGILVTLLRAQSFRRHKAVRVVLAVVIVFVVCHLPYNVSLFCQTINLFKHRSCQSEKAILIAAAATKCLAYLHCCLNPVLYAFIGETFRNSFKKILIDLWCQGKKYIYSNRSTSKTSELYIQAVSKTPEVFNNEIQLSFTM